MNTEMIAKTETFLKDTFAASTYLQSNPADRDYRLEHSYRVANIAKTISEAEGFDVTKAVIALKISTPYMDCPMPGDR